MIMSSYKLVAFSSRKLCRGSLLEQIDTIAKKKKPDMLVLREKDLSEDEYEVLATNKIRRFSCSLSLFNTRRNVNN